MIKPVFAYEVLYTVDLELNAFWLYHIAIQHYNIEIYIFFQFLYDSEKMKTIRSLPGIPILYTFGVGLNCDCFASWGKRNRKKYSLVACFHFKSE